MSSSTLDEAAQEMLAKSQAFKEFAKKTMDAFGGAPAGPLLDSVSSSLLEWLLKQTARESKFARVEVVFDYKSAFHRLPDSVYPGRKTYVQDSQAIRSKLSAPAIVLAQGEGIPGKDVAVLRMGSLPETCFVSPGYGDLASAGLFYCQQTAQMDKLICLPLGDSDEALPGCHIHALGYPQIAFDDNLMDQSAEFKPSMVPGEISQRKTFKGGQNDQQTWDAFEMSADINHGDSGGPVLDEHGKVIAINVGGSLPHVGPSNEQLALAFAQGGVSPAGHNYAVPINIAKEFIEKAGVKPDPGPVSRLWAEGLDLYSRGRYSEAEKKFQEVEDMQNGSGTAFYSSTISRAGWFASPYVQEMKERCAKKLK
jgi:hypothetical protein